MVSTGGVRYDRLMTQPPDVTEFAASILHLIQRFTGNQPDALAQMRRQVENELAGGKEIVARATAQLAALDQLQALIDQGPEPTNGTPTVIGLLSDANAAVDGLRFNS